MEGDNFCVKNRPLPSIHKPAPRFKGTAVINEAFRDISLDDYKGKYLVLMFYPLDFTFVCPTEIVAFSEAAKEFEKIKASIVACSTDSVYTHLAWIQTPRTEGGLGEISIPLLSDKSMGISRSYGVLNDSTGIPFRALFIIDNNGLVRQITVNDLQVGRCVEEIFRLIEAFQFTDEFGEVCPINWKPGEKTIKPDPVKAKSYFMEKSNE